MKMVSSLLFTVGIVAIILGFISPVIPLFNLPGDFVIKSKQTVIMFPLATSLLLSFIVSFVMWLCYK